MKISFLLLLSLFELSSPYKVLVFNPAFGASHSNFLGKISDLLIDAGHNVTMLIPIFEARKKDLVGSKKVQNIIRIPQDSRISQAQLDGNTEEFLRKMLWTMSSDISALAKYMETFEIASGYQCNNIFQQSQLLEQLTNEHFDLAFSESLFVCAFALFERIGVRAPMIADSILTNVAVRNALGEPAAASHFPCLTCNFSDKMTFSQRAKNLFTMLFSEHYASGKNDHELESIKDLYVPKKTAKELLAGVAFNFLNSNQYLEFPSPILPKTVFIGGMQIDSENKPKLDKPWNEILSLRGQNVLVSFGSMTLSKDMPEEFKSAFLQVFASMPDTTFIWKYEEANATLAVRLPNVHLTTWMPQNDLLADPRLSLFITHGGLGSSLELAYQGKPAVVIPLTADQPRNAQMLTRHGGAIQMDKTDLDKPEIIKKAVLTVLEDPSYRKNAEKLAKILEEQPYKPKDVVLRHCDFAVKHGALKTLNSEGRHLNTLQYYSVDIALLGILVVLVIIAVLITVLKMSKKVLFFVVQLLGSCIVIRAVRKGQKSKSE